MKKRALRKNPCSPTTGKRVRLPVTILRRDTSNPSPLDDLPGVIPVLERELRLTRREAEVLTWMMIGRTNHQIADVLTPTCAPSTVAVHVRQILLKLGVENRTGAARRGFEVLHRCRSPEPLL